MRKFCLALAAVSALVLGGWATYGVAGPPNLTVVSDSEAIEAIGGQSCPTQCQSVYSQPSCTSVVFIKPCGSAEQCPGGTWWDFTGQCGNTSALGQWYCTTTCCNINCNGGVTVSYTTCN